MSDKSNGVMLPSHAVIADVGVNPFPDRFNDPQYLVRKDGDGGITPVMQSTQGMVLIDFGRPIQTLALSVLEAQGMSSGMVRVTMVAMQQEEGMKDQQPN